MTRASRGDVWLWPLTFAAAAVRVLEVGPPLQPVVLAAFLLLCPGACLIGGAPSWSWLVWMTGVLSCSVALSLVVATSLLYAGWWTPDAVLGVLIAFCLLGSSLHYRARTRVVVL